MLSSLNSRTVRFSVSIQERLGRSVGSSCRAMGTAVPGSGAPLTLTEHRLFGCVRRLAHQRSDLLGALLPLPQDVGRDDLGVRGVRAPDADANAAEVRGAEALLERLQAVVAGQAAADAVADVTERQVDLVMQREDVVEVGDLERAAG